MADFPQLDTVYQKSADFKLAVHRAALQQRMRFYIYRNDETAIQLKCSGVDDTGKNCTATIGVERKDDGTGWILRKRILDHSHPFTEATHERYAQASRKAIEQVELGLGGRRKRVAEDDDDGSAVDELESYSGSEAEEQPKARSPGAAAPASSSHEKRKGGQYPSGRDAKEEIQQLINDARGILPFPTSTTFFPDSRQLLLQLHAAAHQRGFRVYRISPIEQKTSVKLSCSLGHTQSSHRPLCRARFNAVKGASGWHMVNDTVTKHTHPVLDEQGQTVEPLMDGSDISAPTTPMSRKRPRAEDRPKASNPQNSSSAMFAPRDRSAHPPRPSTAQPHVSRAPSSTPLAPFLPSRAPHPSSFLSRTLSTASAVDMTFLPSLTRFLSSLHPRLSSLAPILLEQARLDSIERLVLFLTLTSREETLELALKDLSSLPPLGRHLLKKELKRVRDAGWPTTGGGASLNSPVPLRDGVRPSAAPNPISAIKRETM